MRRLNPPVKRQGIGNGPSLDGLFRYPSITMLPKTRAFSKAIAGVICLVFTPLPAFPQETLQLNVPYRCQDGVTRTVTRCERNARGGEVCFWREEENGQISERYNVRGQMDGWLATCKAQPAAATQPAPPPPAAPARPAPQQQPAAPSSTSAAAAAINSPGGQAMRRCLELGGGELECLGKGFTTDIPFLGELQALLGSTAPVGIRLGGPYQTSGGIKLDFANDKAQLAGCGMLVVAMYDYTVTRRGTQFDVEIVVPPAPLKLVLGADGQLRGPTALDIQGSVVVGFKTERSVERRVSDGTIVPGSEREQQIPVTEPRTARCGFGVLRSTGPMTAEGSLIGGLVGLAGGQSDPASQRAGTAEAPAGPRMAGKYAGANGFQLEFQPTAVVLDCGEAHVIRPYDVRNSAERFAITVRNGSVPFSLTLRPDGTLTGMGTVEVAGRVVSRSDASGITFAPRTTRCELGVMTPRP